MKFLLFFNFLIISCIAVFSDGYLSSTGFKYISLGQNGSLSFTNPFPLSAVSQFTITIWIKRPLCTNLKSMLLTCHNSFEVHATNTFNFIIFGITTQNAQSNEGMACLGSGWTHVGFTFGNSDLKIYVNGQQDGIIGKTSVSNKIIGDNFETCYIGNDGINYGVNAYVRNLVILTKEYTKEQIASLIYTMPGWSSDLLIYNEMDDTLLDKYRNSVSLSGSGDYIKIKSNEPEDSCYCTGIFN